MSTNPTSHPVSVQFEYPRRSSRWLALATLLFMIPKAIILVPHLIILWVLGILSFLCAAIGQLVVLISGHYPRNLYDIVAGTLRWRTRVNSYLLGLTDTYPPFRLEE